jgi:hypothetical protein
MYKTASLLKLRFATPVGVLSVEQLWDLSQGQITKCIVATKKLLKKENDDDLSFLDNNKVSDVDFENQLKFDILKDVYLTNKKELEEARTATEKKEHNQKILMLIAEKKEGDLKGKSIEELEAMLK